MYYLVFEDSEGKKHTSRKYSSKEEMWDNYDFLTAYGYKVNVKVA